MQPPKILLGDGDSASCQQFRDFFERLGWRYTVAETGAQLLDAVKKEQFDVVITDLVMPSLKGVGLLSDILKSRPGQAVIALSNEASLDQAMTFFRSGASDLLARPIDFSWLERSVRQLVQGVRNDARERDLNRYLIRHNSEYLITSRDLAQHGFVSLPIISQLRECNILDDQGALKMRLGIQEVVVNALEHGNLELRSEWKEEIYANGVDRFSVLRRERLQSSEFADRSIRIIVQYEPGILKISVRDCGEGFLNKLAPSSSSAEGGVQCHGRGLALISSSADELHFEANGAEVTIVKYLPTEGHGTEI